MAYDRYAAICYPLLYSQVMSSQLFERLVWASWGLGFLDAVFNIPLAMNLNFYENPTVPVNCLLSSLCPALISPPMSLS